jgi:pyrroline-5-carboxylate reductase
MLFGFIGTGHLGSMLVRKFVETEAVDSGDILASNRTPEKADRLAQATNIRTATNRTIAELADVVFICVRPLEVADVLKELEPLLTPEKLLISVAGDVSLKTLRALCGSRVVRAFPSMTSERLKGVTLLAFGDNATAADRHLTSQLFWSIGEVAHVDEKDFEVLADLTSCAPGYFAALLREFVLAAKCRGIGEELAERLVKETFLGTALLLEGESFQGLISSVATKGGITEAGVKVIEEDAPAMFDRLFLATQARHEQVKKRTGLPER